MVAHTFNPSTWGGRGRSISEFKASLVYRVSSRTAKATQRNPVSKNKTKNSEKESGEVGEVREVRGCFGEWHFQLIHMKMFHLL